VLTKILVFLGAGFEVWDALTYAGVPGGKWLLPAGIAAFLISLLIP
jgi:hypothetical protein